MNDQLYRVAVSFDPERECYLATFPELIGLQVEGSTRAEAVSRAEEELDSHLQRLHAEGESIPQPVDGEEVSGELTLQISKALHRELLLQSRLEKIPLEQLTAELLAVALGQRKAAPRPVREERRHRDDGGRRGRGRGRGGPDSSAILNDKAQFLEYVRNLERGGGRR